MIALALALRPGGHFSDFKRSMTEVIKTSIDVLAAAPLSDTHHWSKHRDELLDLLLPKSDERRVRLRVLLTGDLRSDRITWYCPGGASCDEIHEYAELLADNLMPFAPEVFSRTRWMGSVTPLGQLALLASVHNLLPRAILHWQGKSPEPTREAQIQDEFGPVHANAEDMPVRGNPADAGGFQAHAAEDGDGQEAAAAPPAAMPGMHATVSPNDWTAWNAKQQRDSVQFAQSGCQVVLLISFIALRPLVALQRSVEYIDSDTWEQQQMHQVIAGQPLNMRLVQVASLAQTEQFFSQVEDFMRAESLWNVLSDEDKTVKNLSIAAGMLMTMMCGIAQLMRWSHTSFPVRLFCLLREPSRAHEILHACRKLRDPFTEAFLTKWSTVAELKSAACRLELFLILLMVRKSIARIECRHASIKRRIGGRSSAKKEAFLDTSSAFVLMRQRILENARQGHAAAQKLKAAQQAQEWTRRTRQSGKYKGTNCGGGGRQRAAFSVLLKALGGGGKLTQEERRDIFLTAHRCQLHASAY